MRRVNRVQRKLKKRKKVLTWSILLSVLGIVCFFSFKALVVAKEKKFLSNFKVEASEKESNSKNENAIQPQNKISAPIEIILSSVGDCTIGTDPKFDQSLSLPTVAMNSGEEYSYLFKNVISIFSKDDITIANLETTFTNSNEKAEKQFNFKAPPEFAKSLTLGSIEGVNISNNHIYDYLSKGINDTIDALKNNNIGCFGEGNKWIKQVKGVKLGFLGYAGWNYTDEFEKEVKEDIKDLKSQNCAAVVVNFHWGSEDSYHPDDTQKKVAHYAIDEGADLIIGHHPHVVQGIEKYKDKTICYSMGNFCFGGNFNPSDKDTFILQAKFNFKDNKLLGYTTRVVPCSISSVEYKNDYCPIPLEGEKKRKVLEKINDLSGEFKVSDEF